MNRINAEKRDQADSLASYRQHFKLDPKTIYLCGHSLGAMHKKIPAHLKQVLNQQWGKDGVNAWENADWMTMPQRIGGKIAALIGAKPHEVLVADSTSINLFKLLVAALKMQPERYIILTEADNFPTDLYIAQGITELLPHIQIMKCTRHEIAQHINQQTAVVMLSHVNYRTGELYDLKQMTEIAHRHGALILFDVAHSAGVIPLNLNQYKVDFAVGCGYKFLNGGPGAPSFLYIAEQHHASIHTPLTGWMGHQSPFDFANDYIAAPGIRRFLCGTPAILSMAALEKSIDFLNTIPLSSMRSKSQMLSNFMIELMTEKCPAMQLISPRDATQRGAHLGFMHPHAYRIHQELLEHGITCDFRPPDLLRFGLSPLYVSYTNIYDTVEIITKLTTRRKTSCNLT